MASGWIRWSGVACAAGFALLQATALNAADNGVRTVAEELGERTKPAESSGDSSKGMSDSAVRVFMTYAVTIIPDEMKGADGKAAKVDKSDPNKFMIPPDDARRVIRAATRSAYAEVCNLKDLERANYETLIRGEAAKRTWSEDQMMLINALHMFAVSYFTGNAEITTKEIDEAKGQAPKPDESTAKTMRAKPPQCSPEQKQKVAAAIDAYVKSASVAAPNAAPPAPVAGGGN